MNREERRKKQRAKQATRHSKIRASAPDIATPTQTTTPSHSPAPAANKTERPGSQSNSPDSLANHQPPATGPTTPEGKAISSRNATKHGLCAKILTGSDLEQLNDLRASLHAEWEPATTTEELLLEQMAVSQWRLDRALELELKALEVNALDGNFDPAALPLALRYRTSAERSFYKSLAELQRLRTTKRQDTLREANIEKQENTAALRLLEAQILGPLPPRQQFVSKSQTRVPSVLPFVSQNAQCAAPPDLVTCA
jgi:hypothetical protein